VVLTRSPAFTAVDCLVVGSIEEARRTAASAGPAPLMVIGGADLYRQCLPLAQRIHLTEVHASAADADTFFDGWRGEGWREAFRERHAADDRNEFPYSFVTLERAGPSGA
jgi:dihydrofolate reductase